LKYPQIPKIVTNEDKRPDLIHFFHVLLFQQIKEEFYCYIYNSFNHKQRGYFMPRIQVTNGILNLFQLQEELDGILFNYIDTSQKWDKAYEELKELLDELTAYFKNYLQEHDGRLPDNEMYWSLFIDNVSRILYFKTVAYMNLQKDMTEEQKELIKSALHDAAGCLPHVQGRNFEFLQEISQTYDLLFNENAHFEKYYFDKNNGLADCLENFKAYCVQKVLN